MTTKPTTYPVWCTTPAVATDKDAPDAAKQASGFKRVGGVPEKPPFQDFNWYMNLAYQWILYFDGAFSQTIGVTVADNQTTFTQLGSLSFDPTALSMVKLFIGFRVGGGSARQCAIEVWLISDGTSWTAVNWTEPAGTALSELEFQMNGSNLEYKSGNYGVAGTADVRVIQLEIA